MSDELKKHIEQTYNARKKYLRAKETAVYLGIGLSTVWHYAKIGKLTPKKISERVTVFSIDEVNALVDNAEVA